MAWWERARPGDKVVCVNARKYLSPVRGWPLKDGAEYTVTGFDSVPGTGVDGVPGHVLAVTLAEISNPRALHGSPDGFDVRRFRPVQPTRTRTQEQVRKLSDIGLSKLKESIKTAPAKTREGV